MASMQLKVGENDLVGTLDTQTYTNVDAVVLKPLPDYAKQNTSQINHYVTIVDDTGAILPEVMDGDFDLIASIGSFAVGSSNVIRIAFAQGRFANITAAKIALEFYVVLFDLNDTASYVKDAYDVKIYDLGNSHKTFDSVIIGDQQLLDLMKSHIDIGDLGSNGMNPFVIEIYPQIKV
jgi:hypothetical protein